MAKTSSIFKFYSDNSGVPYNKNKETDEYETLVIGMVSISKNHIKNLIKTIEQKYSIYWNQKGRQLDASELEIIINYLNKNHVKMVTIMFEHKDWDKYRKMYPHETHFGEKIMSILYFFVLKNLARTKFMYEAVLDNDTNFGIYQSIRECKRLLNRNYYNFDLFLGHREINPELRLPDWVAQARRKIPEENLKKYENFIILKSKLPKQYRLSIFKTVGI